ncbi:hypothetical protein LEP1GSC062_3505 [Leptospira alexanderi serovar Manhao 3 str. L 60]|uniref:Uncharacterized protein n=1 Tax=Leptospira alexanderi serovar Manhao 3 str. L 60 TaxID=1049759 RepID=V6HWU0_9LEPT|nr:hypothetical protein LEP1GSC062_3505 [Leptospira alexanderi serovar Manhao 3 str. L 60]
MNVEIHIKKIYSCSFVFVTAFFGGCGEGENSNLFGISSLKNSILNLVDLHSRNLTAVPSGGLYVFVLYGQFFSFTSYSQRKLRGHFRRGRVLQFPYSFRFTGPDTIRNLDRTSVQLENGPHLHNFVLPDRSLGQTEVHPFKVGLDIRITKVELRDSRDRK